MHKRGEEGWQFYEGKGKSAKSSLGDQRSREMNYRAGGRGADCLKEEEREELSLAFLVYKTKA